MRGGGGTLTPFLFRVPRVRARKSRGSSAGRPATRPTPTDSFAGVGRASTPIYHACVRVRAGESFASRLAASTHAMGAIVTCRTTLTMRTKSCSSSFPVRQPSEHSTPSASWPPVTVSSFPRPSPSAHQSLVRVRSFSLRCSAEPSRDNRVARHGSDSGVCRRPTSGRGSFTLFELLSAEGVDQSFMGAEPAPDPSSPP